MLKDNNISVLIKRLQKEGLIKAKTYAGAFQVMHYWIRTGKLTPRQLPHNGYYQFNDEEIEEIVKAFSVGGNGFWNWKEVGTDE